MESKYSTKEIQQFLQYEKVRLSGQYNMITQSGEAMKEARLNEKQYLFIVHKYTFMKPEIERLYGSVETAIELFDKGEI